METCNSNNKRCGEIGGREGGGRRKWGEVEKGENSGEITELGRGKGSSRRRTRYLHGQQAMPVQRGGGAPHQGLLATSVPWGGGTAANGAVDGGGAAARNSARANMDGGVAAASTASR